MSRKGAKASKKEPDEHQSVSVYDFLYHDSRRIGSFLAQFDEAGHLQRVTQSESTAKGTRRSWSLAAGGGVADLAQGNLSVERGPAEAGAESLERVYDPLWSNALTLLDYLETQEMINRDISKARIGQFVLAQGNLSILDLTLIKSMWSLPSIKAQIAQGARGAGSPGGNRAERRRASKHPSSDESLTNAQLLTEIMSIMPHAVQAFLTGEGNQIWCSLREDSLVVSSSDLFLKHGASVPGSWHALGILDALPDDDAGADEFGKLTGPTAEQHMAIQLLLGGFGAVVEGLGPLVRTLLGRPSRAFGITPLLLFREVSK